MVTRASKNVISQDCAECAIWHLGPFASQSHAPLTESLPLENQYFCFKYQANKKLAFFNCSVRASIAKQLGLYVIVIKRLTIGLLNQMVKPVVQQVVKLCITDDNAIC